ncbi:DUF2141 domain-containing protein [Cellulophaga sp. Hel_I_12]|uniref:DUF2141 domain-containing protein n=1 Tax=Cellulophaga sp. Hel_I_12 TaxID=1249972 RepID=UPI000645CF36|nr:DUF2141 domain-containing protein [Cellulophaga sp. Hel_I_12]
MKNLAIYTAFLFLTSFGFSQEAQGQNITVTIDNVLSNEGKVLLSLHTTDTFMKGPGIQNLESTIIDGKVSFTFKNVAIGEYAIMALHDANDNKQMDFETNGMPKENYGMSGNEMSFGPPSFGDAKFEVKDEDLSFIIRF